MTDISLREYIQKVENLIENNEIDQAIAHCKHILHIYPKHIDSYRLLGKAFLEKQKFSDASDIFQRVLSSIPDDFISHIGMSIIREDENNLDASIWHMERAFEVQPSNKAVQDELRRLYTNRDGVAPPKIRLTRGALVRMYMRGELYEQAIGEIKTALDEDPNRIDLEVILAKIYFNTDQKVEATEVCSKVITKLPYCFEANKILTEILPGTTREEDQKIFRQRVIDLDPYFEFTSDNIKDTLEISDSKIMVDYLDWDPLSDVYDQPDWAKSIGLSVEDENSLDNDISFWLSDSEKESSENIIAESIADETTIDTENEESDDSIIEEKLDEFSESEESPPDETEMDSESSEDIQTDDLQPTLVEETSSDETDFETSEEELPEWLKDAGWEKSTNEDDEIQKGYSIPPIPAESIEETSENEELDSVEPGEIPDWIKEIAPSEELLEEENLNEEEEFELTNLEALISDIETEETPSKTDEKISTWESEFLDNIPESSVNKENEVEDENLEINNLLSDIYNLENEDQDDSEVDDEDNLDWLKSISLDEDQVDDVETNLSQDKNLDFNNLFTEETVQGELADPSEEDNEDWISSILEDETETALETDKAGDFSPEVSDESEEELPDWIKSVVADEVEDSEIIETVSEQGLGESEDFKVDSEFEIGDSENIEIDSKEDFLEVPSISENELTENQDEITISFDEKDEIPELDNLDLEESVIDTSVKPEELEDELEEKLAFQTLSQLEEEMISEIEDLPELQEESDLSDFPKETEDTLSTPESNKEDIESTIAWMEGLVAAQSLQSPAEDTVEKDFEESVEEKPEWVTEILKSPQSDLSDLDTTPSWLRELEIEAENAENESNVLENLQKENVLTEGKEEEIIPEVDDLAVVLEQETSADLIEDEDQERFQELSDLEIERSEDFLQAQTEDIEHEVDEFLQEDDRQDQEIEPSLVGSEMSLETEIESVESTENTDFDETILSPVEEISEEASEELIDTQLDSIEEISEEATEEFVDTKFSSGEEFSEESTEELVDTQLTPIEEISEEVTEELADVQPEVDEAPIGIDHLEEAKRLLNSGEVIQSIDVFNDLIKNNIFLEDIISDIQNALDHHYPINIDLWKTLGDAFLKNKEFQKALDAYSKAEDLLS
jgi:Tfp pilus assembly protein PilF